MVPGMKEFDYPSRLKTLSYGHWKNAGIDVPWFLIYSV